MRESFPRHKLFIPHFIFNSLEGNLLFLGERYCIMHVWQTFFAYKKGPIGVAKE